MDEIKEVAPDMVPLLDVVFQLIMFFMITMSFIQIGQMNHEVNLPIAQTAIPLDQKVQDWVFLNINRNGQIIGLSQDVSSEAKLKDYIQNEYARLVREKKGEDNVNLVVIIRADQDAPYLRIYRVLQNCKRAGVSAWQLRVKTKPGGGRK